MSEHTTVLSVTYQILGESEEFSVTVPIVANRNTTLEEISQQLNAGVQSQEMFETTMRLAMALMLHIARNTREEA